MAGLSPRALAKVQEDLASDWDKIFFNLWTKKPVVWQELHDNISVHLYVESEGLKIGHVENMIPERCRRQVWVGHFATTKDLCGEGLGRPLAFALQHAVSKSLGVSRIEFQESHTQFWDIGYNGFFERLGAVPRQGRDRTRPAWIWDWGTEPVAGDEWRGKPPV